MLVAGDTVLRALASISQDGDLSGALRDVVYEAHFDDWFGLSRSRVEGDDGRWISIDKIVDLGLEK